MKKSVGMLCNCITFTDVC